MRALLLVFSAFVMTACGQPSIKTANDVRIVSTSLCGDSYVLDIAPRADIAALSWQSGDKLSRAPADLRALPKAWDDAERLLALSPSLVVFGPGEGSVARPLLDKAGVKYVTLKWGEDFSSVSENNLLVASVANLSAPAPIDQPVLSISNAPRVLYLSPTGATAGPGTYVHAAMTRAGGINIITQQGWHTPPLEHLAVLSPDFIVTSFFQQGYASVNEAGMGSKILRSKLANTPHINVPGNLWPCAGPHLYEASDLINDGLVSAGLVEGPL